MMLYRVWLRSAECRRPTTRAIMPRRFSTKPQAVRKPPSQPEITSDSIQQLEREAARMLNVVKKKLSIRADALNQVTCYPVRLYVTSDLFIGHKLRPDTSVVSNSQKIDNLRLIKELEPLQLAWDTYTLTKQVG